jgi:hypothetical protein
VGLCEISRPVLAPSVPSSNAAVPEPRQRRRIDDTLSQRLKGKSLLAQTPKKGEEEQILVSNLLCVVPPIRPTVVVVDIAEPTT